MLFLSVARQCHAARAVPFIISVTARGPRQSWRVASEHRPRHFLLSFSGSWGVQRPWAQCLAGDTGQGTVWTTVRHRPGMAFGITTTWLWSGVCVWWVLLDLLGV